MSRPTRSQFNLLELLHLLGNDGTRPVGAIQLAARLEIQPDSVSRRMSRLIAAGWVVSRVSSTLRARGGKPHLAYVPTNEGRKAYRLELARMDGVTAPPVLHPAIEIATSVTVVQQLAYGFGGAA